MKWIKKYISRIYDRSLSLQERMFRLFAAINFLGFILVEILSIATGDALANVIPVTLILIVYVILIIWTIRTHHIQTGAVIIAFVFIYILLPVSFFTSGGIYSGNPIWMIFGVVYVCLNVYGRAKYFYIASCGVIYPICYAVSYYHPEYVIAYDRNDTFVDSVFALLIIGTLLVIMLTYQNHIYQEENRIAEEQKREIEELNATQSRFFSSMSHEIRTPINTIIGLDEMILRETDSEDVRQDAKNIASASELLLSIINDILDMSKLESGNLRIIEEEYDLGDLLSDIVNLIWVRASEKDLQFHVNVEKHIPSHLVGDAMRIKQVLINLLNNAVKYTDTGSVTLSIYCEHADQYHADFVFSVIDTGIGIRKEDVNSLFGVFQRVDERRNRAIEGSGLGLSIVKQLVDLMHGTISVDSVYTKGSTFVVTIPQKVVGFEQIGEYHIEERHNVGEGYSYAPAFTAPRAKVLVVDDNHLNLTVVEKLLRGTKVSVVTAGSGAEALKKTANEQFDLIYMDHYMPQMDGITCLHKIRTQPSGLNATTPIVALTANAGSENEALYAREGFDGYLLKPVSGKLLELETLHHLPISLIETRRQEDTAIEEVTLGTHAMKAAILISSEYSCDLPKDVVDRYHISQIPSYIVTQKGEFLDGIEIPTNDALIYDKEGAPALIKPPSVEEYEIYFADLLTKGRRIVHICPDENFGPWYAVASRAAESFDHVEVIGIPQCAGGAGMVVERMAKRVLETELSMEDVASLIQTYLEKTDATVLIGTSEKLFQNRFISQRQSMVSRALNSSYQFRIRDGGMHLGNILFGLKERKWRSYIHQTLRHKEGMDTSQILVTCVGLTQEERDFVENEIRQSMDFDEVVLMETSASTAISCGGGSFGITVMRK